MALLKGEIIVQMGKDVSQTVAYQTMWEQVQVQLDSAAEDPDLPELFGFLISAVLGQNSYAQEFQYFAACFVNSRQTKATSRFCSAFAVASNNPRAGSSDEALRHEDGLRGKSHLLAFVLTQKLGGRHLHGQC